MNKIKSRTIIISLAALLLLSVSIDKIAVNPDIQSDRQSPAIVQTDLSERSRSSPLQQSTTDLDELYRQATAAQLDLERFTQQVAQQLGGEALIPKTLKTRERSLEKIAADYNGDVSRITDIARSSVIFETEEQVLEALNVLRQDTNIVRIRNRFESPVNGYRDVLLNILMPNGHIAEIQLHLRTILDVKYKFGDKIYREIRTIEANASKERRDITVDEAKRIKKLNYEAKKLYDEAFEKSKYSLSN